MTNEEKKKWLSSYIWLCREVDRVQEELEHWRSVAEKTTQMYDGMPPGGSFGSKEKISVSVEKIMKWERVLDNKIDAMVNRRKEIEDVITAVSDPTLRLLLQYRYVDGLTWESIASKLHYDIRWVLTLHGRALQALQIPEEKSCKH